MTQYNPNVTYEDRFVSFRTFITKVFSTMAIGLLISGVVAFIVSISLYSIIMALGNAFFILMMIAIVAELAVGIGFSAGLMKMSKKTAWICYIAYSALTGLSLALVVSTYTPGTVLFAFVSTVILFACMAIIGHTTNIDLTRFGSVFMVGLISIIITSLLNMLFFHSEMLNYIMAIVGVLVFLGLIAYDMQKLRAFYERGTMDADFQEKMMVYGAFTLYLDFINLFLRLLQIFGRRSSSRN